MKRTVLISDTRRRPTWRTTAATCWPRSGRPSWATASATSLSG